MAIQIMQRLHLHTSTRISRETRPHLILLAHRNKATREHEPPQMKPPPSKACTYRWVTEEGVVEENGLVGTKDSHDAEDVHHADVLAC